MPDPMRYLRFSAEDDPASRITAGSTAPILITWSTRALMEWMFMSISEHGSK